METIDSVKNLEKVGFSRPQAEMQIQVIGNLMKDYATKDDLKQGLHAVRVDVHSLRIEMDAKFTMVESKIDVLTAKVDNMDIKFETKIAALDSKFEANFSALNSKFDTKFFALESKFDTKFSVLDSKFENLPIKTALYLAGLLVALGTIYKFMSFFIH